jgi:molecular chaperone DnaJ
MIKLTFALMSEIKDYYRILNIKSSASPGEIKNAYRRLAMKYHPDRNAEDALAAAVFTDIAEAYKVLSDAEARKQYNYDRYLTADKEYKRPLETLDASIFRITKINEQLKYINPFRFNKDALLYSIIQIFPEEIDLLLYTNKDQLKIFLEKIIYAATFLSSHQTKKLAALLQPLSEQEKWLSQSLGSLIKKQQKAERWEKSKVFLVILFALILCAIIFFAARK